MIDTGYRIQYMGELRLENYDIVGQVSRIKSMVRVAQLGTRGTGIS